MYRLEVFHDDSARPTESARYARAAQVLEAIPPLLKKHPDCARIDVYLQNTRLFSVNCEGERIEP